MALEIRMVREDGKLARTMEDVTTPDLPVDMSPGTMLLAEYCFNSDGPWVRPEELLQAEDVAAVVFSRRGQIESMIVGGRGIRDEQEMYRLFHVFHGTTLTRYPRQRGKELYMFHLSPKIKRRLSKPWRRKKLA